MLSNTQAVRGACWGDSCKATKHLMRTGSLNYCQYLNIFVVAGDSLSDSKDTMCRWESTFKHLPAAITLHCEEFPLLKSCLNSETVSATCHYQYYLTLLFLIGWTGPRTYQCIFWFPYLSQYSSV